MSLPVNISLMNIDEFVSSHQCKPVTSLFIHESSSDSFHHDGLFSEEIFGQIGSSERLITFGYIDLHTTIMHPLIYGYLIRIKGLYGAIMSGKSYAVFDKKEHDFVQADADDPEAGTGYKFFIDRFNDIVFRRTGSVTQGDKVSVIEKYRKSCIIDKFLVLPAGLRDMDPGEGKPASDSINKLYSSLMNYCKAMPMNAQAANSDVFDSVRFAIQKKANEIYEFLYDMINGKFGYFQRKYASRNLALGTRNVISPADMSGAAPDDPAYLKCDEIKVPVFQAAKMFQPLIVYWFKYAVAEIFQQFSDQIAVINPNTLKLEYKPISEDEKNAFTTSDGIEKVITRFRDKESRFDPVCINSEDGKEYYLFLIYDRGSDIYIVRDIDAFSKQYQGEFIIDKTRFRPITYSEFIYYTVYLTTVNRYAYVTRYPAIEIGSTVPCRMHVGTTSPSRKVILHPPQSNAINLPEYPIIGNPFVDTTILHPSILKGLGADFDGNCVVGSTIVKIRYTHNWLDKIAEVSSDNSISPMLDNIKNKTYLSDEEYHYAELRMDEFPHVGEFILDKNGARVYTVPEGVYVESFNNVECTTTWSRIEHITVEDDCDVAEVVLKSDSVTVSTNESVAVFDHESGNIKRVKPEDCGFDTYVPIVTKSNTPFGAEGTFDGGYICGKELIARQSAGDVVGDEWIDWKTGSEEYLFGVLSGIMNDGKINVRDTENNTTIEIKLEQSRKSLLDIVKKLSYRLGICLDIDCDEVDETTDPIPISNAERQLLLSLVTTDEEKQLLDNPVIERAILKNYIDKLDPTSPLCKRIRRWDIHWESVIDVIPSGHEAVYDFDIPETRLYVVNNGIVTYDTVSVNGVLSEEATEEIKKYLNSKERFIHANSSLYASKTDLINLTIFNLSRDPAY